MPFIRTTNDGSLPIGNVEIDSNGTIIIGNTIINSTSITSDIINLPSGELGIGNSTVNSTIIAVGNVIANTTVLKVGNSQIDVNNLLIGNTVANSTVLLSGNATHKGWIDYKGTYLLTPDYEITANVEAPSIVIANSTISTNIRHNNIKIGNSTVYGSLSSNTMDLLTTSPNTSIHMDPVFISVGNTTTNTVINSSSVSISGATIQANNGFTRLTNGLLIQWGNVLANSSTGNVTFPSEFVTVFQAFVTPSTTNYVAAVTAVNTTVIQVRNSDVGAAAELIRWMAIGI